MKNILAFALLLAVLSACNTTQKCVEKINTDCVCTMQYDPVCGCNNKTYGNACVAECSGIKTYTKGECPQDATVKLEGTKWQLVTFAVSPAPLQVPADVTIFIKLAAGKLEGSGGCNRIGGSYILDGNSLTTSQLFSTKMFCEKAMKWETMFLQQLEKSQSYVLNGETLEINCGVAGNLIFRKQ